MGLYNRSYLALILILSLINHKHIREGITITVVIIKNVPQSPLSQSTNAPEEEARVVLPAVPIEARRAYCVAVYVLSTNKEINATNATVANAADISSAITAIANNKSYFPVQASNAKRRFVTAIKPPATNIVFIVPDLIAKIPPSNVNTTVVIHPKVLE